MKKISYEDILYGRINNQEILSGTSIVVGITGVVYFIEQIFSATSTNAASIKNKAGSVTKAVVKSEERTFVRMDDGFQVIAIGAVQVRFFSVGV